MAMRIAWLKDLRLKDLEQVGGKNASLGEMIGALAAADIRVPGGFATTADAYREFLAQDGLDARISERLAKLDANDVTALARTGAEIRGLVLNQSFPAAFEKELAARYNGLAGALNGASFAVRSSATAEDLPDASFAGQQETFLNVSGLSNLLEAIRHVFASLYNDRAISYRVHKGYAHDEVALSAAVQRMVRSDLAASGVMFSLDTESGFDAVVLITSAYGLGETVVQGQVNPDEFYVYKRALEAGRKAILRRGLGSKAVKMIYGEETQAGRSVKTVPVPEDERRSFSLTDQEVEELARYAI